MPVIRCTSKLLADVDDPPVAAVSFATLTMLLRLRTAKRIISAITLWHRCSHHSGGRRVRLYRALRNVVGSACPVHLVN